MAKWFNTRLRDAREQADLSQVELANKLGVSGPTISNWENRVSEPDDDQRERVLAWVEKLENGSWRRRGNTTERNVDDIESGPEDTDDDVVGPSAVGEWLNKSRVKMNMSVPELAQRADVSTATIYFIESGQSQSPRRETLDKLQRALAGTEIDPEARRAAQREATIEGLGETGDGRRRHGSNHEQDPSQLNTPAVSNRRGVPPRLPANPNVELPMMSLRDADVRRVSALLQHVPEYSSTEWRRLVSNTVGAIHQIPRILEVSKVPNLDLKDIEAYFGRSSAGTTYPGVNLYQRFQAGLKERNHDYGIVFAKTSIRASLNFERFGISLIEQLRRVDGLCISNKTFAARGRVGDIEPGYLYLTFRITQGKEHARKLTQNEIDRAVAGVMQEF